MTSRVVADGTDWEVLRAARTVVEEGLRMAVGRLGEPVRAMAEYHFGWCDAHGEPTSAGDLGKAVRAALVLLCAEAVGGARESVVDVAVAVELVHNFSLVHDDIMDGDRTRRHRSTVWSTFGVPAAILAGDALLVLAVEVLAANPAPQAAVGVRRLCEAMVELVTGQGADMAFERRGDVGLDECVAMAAGKTAALIECACGLGALMGGAEATRVELLRRFGHRLGLAFQLVDDLLGIWGDPEMTGKPVYSDLRAGKKSLPVVAALTAGNDAGQRFATMYLRPQPLCDTELAQAASLIELAGGRAWAQDSADRYVRSALSCLDSARLDPVAATRLVTLAHLITRRDH